MATPHARACGAIRRLLPPCVPPLAMRPGTFLYVAMMEVIPKELAHGDMRMAKMACLIAGFSAMSVLAIWA